jgi:arginase
MQQSLHFYKANSRLGMKYLPFHGKELNLGVENGPSALLTKQFLAKLKQPYLITDFNFPTPDKCSDANYLKTIAQSSEQFSFLINSTLKSSEIQIMIGGDHSTSFTSLHSVLDRFAAAKVGYLQFDSHADLNTYSSSPTKNFHGMFLRPFVDGFDSEVISNLIEKQLPVENLIYIGNLELDGEEKHFIEENSIKIIDRNMIQKNATNVEKAIKELLFRINHLHISFDIDVFSKDLVSATGTPGYDGLLVEEVFPILDLIAKFPSISIDLVEVNPEKENPEHTIKIAQEVLLKLIG